MSRLAYFVCLSLFLAITLLTLPSLLNAQAGRNGSAQTYGHVTVAAELHHDRSEPLRSMSPSTTSRHSTSEDYAMPKFTRPSRSAGASADSVPQVNGGTGVATTLGFFNLLGVGNFFNGPNGSFTPATTPSDATGAVGTTQYLQWVDDSFAVFSKATGSILVGPMPGNTIWAGFGGPCETDNDGQPTVNFDKLANRWVVSQYAMSSGAPYLQCVAVSTTDDATGTWNRYSFQIGYLNTSWVNRDAKLGVWPDAYYMSFDMYAGTTFVGPKFCALQRSSMLAGQPAGIQCVQLQSQYFGAIVSDLDGLTPPPVGAPAYFAADDLNYFALDFWKFHIDWNDSQNSTLSLPVLLNEGLFNEACSGSGSATCVQQPNGTNLNPYGNFVVSRLPYRNYPDHQSLFAAETVETVTGIRFYEMRIAPNGDLSLYQEGTYQPDTNSYRFIPAIATDRAGNIAVGYNLSSSQIPPSQYVATRAPGDAPGTLGNETVLNPGNASQTTSVWDTRATLTVDPVDDCTYYYTQQYQPTDGTNNWTTQIEDFTLAGCQVATVTLQTTPVNLRVSENSTIQLAPFSGQFAVGSTLALSTTSPQAGAPGVRYAFKSWSDGGAMTHSITVPSAGATYTAAFNTQYALTSAVAPVGGGKITPVSGSFFNAGKVASLTATPAAGYAFTNWTGSVANPKSATTTITMNAPQTISAVFTPLPTTVNAALTSQSGPSNARVWSFSFTNKGPGQANNIYINTFVLTQSTGAACTPVVITKLPELVGSVAPGGVVNGSVSINFSSCASNVRFSLTMGSSENKGASHATLKLSNLAM